MAKRIRRALIGAPDTCIFCDRKVPIGGHLSGEHLYSKWIRDVLPPDQNRGATERLDRLRFKQTIGEVQFRQHSSAVRFTKLHVVCALCNNGWMSRLDNRAKPIATPLIKGERTVLTSDMQMTLAKWLVLKLLVLEASPKIGVRISPIFGRSERARFMRDERVPAGFVMWLGPGGGPKWREGIQIQTGGLLASPVKLSRVDLEKMFPAKENVQTMTWGVGHAVFSVVATTSPDVTRVQWPTPFGHIQLWPVSGSDIGSPPSYAITDWMLDVIASRYKLRLGQSIPMAQKPHTPL